MRDVDAQHQRMLEHLDLLDFELRCKEHPLDVLWTVPVIVALTYLLFA
jgi:hypothetical protein